MRERKLLHRKAKKYIDIKKKFKIMSELLNRFFVLENSLSSDDLGEVVKGLKDIEKMIRRTENRILLNSVISKTAMKFEDA